VSERAWTSNIEVGVYMNYEELVHNGIDRQLEQYFSQIEAHSTPLSKEIYNEQLTLSKRRANIDDQDEAVRRAFNEKREIPLRPGLAAVDKKTGTDRRFAEFEREWKSTLQIMRDIGSRVSEDKVRPNWIRAEVPPSVQADQFLHAYYYRIVRSGNSHPFEEFHSKNVVNPEKALEAIAQWWTSSDFDYEAERRHLHEWAPRVRELCARDRILKLSRDELIELLSLIHAVRDHVSKLSKEFLGLSQSTANIDERIEAFADWIARQRSLTGNGILQTFNYVIWGKDGIETESITQRLWKGQDGEEWALPHIGLSALGELVGWARPDVYPPRNGRTSKALKALGYKVRTSL
jgi:hypothetical protein